MRARGCIALIAALVAISSGCDSKPARSESVPSTSVAVTARNRSRATTTTLSLEPVVSVAVQPGSRSDFDLAKDDVTGLLCTFADGIWNASGTVTNPTPAGADYRVYLTFTDQSDTFRGMLEVDVPDLDPNETKDWSGHLTLLDPSVTCMLRVERVAR